MQLNSIYQLQHYVVDGTRKVDYFQALMAASASAGTVTAMKSTGLDSTPG